MAVEIRTWTACDLAGQLPRWEAYFQQFAPCPLSRHPAWLKVLQRGLGHEPICVEALDKGQTRGLLPLAYLRSWLFGRFLASLPYVNYGGVIAGDSQAAFALIDRAVQLADEREVRFLELRHERVALEHPALMLRESAKVHMHLDLPPTPEVLWSQLSAKVRNQVRKGQRTAFEIRWGLGTPAFGQRLFRAILEQFPEQAELCVLRWQRQPVAGALLLHGLGITEVPSASAARESRQSNVNMLMYWHLLRRAIERGQATFDFGRSSPDSGTFRFKKQWGAKPIPAKWQYYLRTGTMDEMRKENPRYERMIRIWQRLPLALTRLLGPWIVRGIP